MDKQPISDDQELAKVLAGVTNDDTINAAAAADASIPTIPTPPEPVAPTDDTGTTATDTPDAATLESVETPLVEPELTMPTMPEPSFSTPAPAADGNLDSIKSEALSELRPLVDKLNVSAEEKFDTYLLLLRSTDDKDLIAPAHDAAKGIADEARRAQALLDIIKEIDFLSQPQS